MAHELSMDRRGKDRFSADLQVQYFIKKQSMRYQDCQLIDISRSGIAVELPPEETLSFGAEISLEMIIPGSFEQITLKGTITRINQEGDKNIAGIKFAEMLAPATFNKIIATK